MDVSLPRLFAPLKRDRRCAALLQMLITSALMMPLGVAADWWDTSWSYRIAFDVTNDTGSFLANQQFLVDLTPGDLHADYTFSAAGDDVRMIDGGDSSSLSYYLRSWDAGSASASILVLVPALAVGETRRIYLYYGNGSATAQSDPIAVLTETGLRYHTRRSSLDPASRTEAVTEFYSLDDSVAGYGCSTVTDFTSINNRNLFSPPSNNSNIAFLSNHHFEVSAAEAGTWEFRFGGDYGYGGGMYVDDTVIEEAWNDDLWWGNNWSNTSETLEGSIVLSEGWHALQLIGFEGCCDGGTSVQYRSPSAPTTWRAWSTVNVDIRSEKCLTNSTPVTTLPADLSGSTHTAVDANGGDLEVGDVIQYTVSLIESGAAAADEVSVTFDVPAGVTNFTVTSFPAGASDASSGTGGSNGTGVLSISGVEIPSGGSADITYEVTVDTVPGGTTFDITASVSNPAGASSLSLAANQVAVALPTTPLTDVIKNLYFYDGDELSRLPPSSNQSRERIYENDSTTWTLTPTLALPLAIDDGASEIRVWLFMRRAFSNRPRSIRITVSGSVSGVIAQEDFSGVSLTNSYTLRSFDVDIQGGAPATLATGEAITVTVYQYSGRGFRVIDIRPSNGTTHSYVEFPTDTAINIETITFHDAAHPAGGTITSVSPGDSIWVRTEVSDPFGEFDITGADIDIVDAAGAGQVTGDAMTEVTGSGWPTTSSKLYEYAYAVPAAGATGSWDVDIVAREGTEGTVVHQAGNSFNVEGDMDIEIDVGSTSASTCFAKDVIVRIVDGGGSPVTSYMGTVSLTASSGNGGWQTSGAGSLVDTDTGDGFASYTFAAADQGEASFGFSNSRADDLRIDAEDAANSLAVTSNLLEFRDNRLQVVEADSLDYDVVAGRDHTFSVELWQRDTSTGNCAIATDYDGTFSLKAWLVRDGADPSGIAPRLSGATSLPAVPDAMPGSNNVDLTFTSGSASFTLTTYDVGVYTPYLRDDTSGFAVDETGSPQVIDSASTSAPYIVRPFAIRVEAVGNPAAATATGTTYVSAGSDFDVTVTGVAYDASDDNGSGGGTANDGIVDDVAGLADNAALPAFGSEGEEVRLAASLVLPAGGNNPGLAGASTLVSSFVTGSGSATYQFNEVGILRLTASIEDANYLGAGATITGYLTTDSETVGRFFPDHFSVTVNGDGGYQPACATGSGYSYTGDTFGYNTAPSFTVVPRDVTGTLVLSNYQDDFAHLTASEITLDYPSADAGNALAVTATPATASLMPIGDGTSTLTLNLLDTFVVDRVPTAEIAPFTLQLPIAVSAIAETLDGIGGSGLPLSANPSGHEIRYGRFRLDNAFGPESQSLSLTAGTEYLSASGWLTNTADSCTDTSGTLATTPDSSPSGSLLDIPVGAGTTDLTGSGPIAAGNAGLVFLAPGAGNIGDLTISVNLGALTYLQYDWDGDGSDDALMIRAVTFGQYRGHDRITYWREI